MKLPCLNSLAPLWGSSLHLTALYRASQLLWVNCLHLSALYRASQFQQMLFWFLAVQQQEQQV